MTPSEMFSKVFKTLSAYGKDKMRFGRFLVAMEVVRIYSDEVICTIRIFETSGFLGLKRTLLYCVRGNSKDKTIELMYGPSGSWYKEFQEVFNA